MLAARMSEPMTSSLLPWSPPDGVELIIAWLSALGVETRDQRPAGAVLPFYQVRRISGPSDRLQDHGLYSISSFDVDNASCQALAWNAHRRMLLLAGLWTPQSPVTLPDGTTAYADDVRVMESPIWVNYGDDTPYTRYNATYHVDLRFVAAS